MDKIKNAWALNELKLEENSTAELLRYLQKEEFVLNDIEFEAVSKLSGLKTDENFSRSSELENVKKSLNTFATNYFQIAPEKRRRKHAEFEEMSEEYPELQPRLEQLKRGLSIDVKQIPASKILDFIMSVYPLPLNKRMEKVFELHKMTLDENKKCYKEFLEIKKKFPKIYCLMPFLERILGPAKQPPKSKKSRAVQTSDSGNMIWLILVIGYFGIKVISMSSSSTYQPPTFPPDVKPTRYELENGKHKNIDINNNFELTPEAQKTIDEILNRQNKKNENPKLPNPQPYTPPRPQLPSIPNPQPYTPPRPQLPSIPNPQPFTPGS